MHDPDGKRPISYSVLFLKLSFRTVLTIFHNCASVIFQHQFITVAFSLGSQVMHFIWMILMGFGYQFLLLLYQICCWIFGLLLISLHHRLFSIPCGSIENEGIFGKLCQNFLYLSTHIVIFFIYAIFYYMHTVGWSMSLWTEVFWIFIMKEAFSFQLWFHLYSPLHQMVYALRSHYVHCDGKNASNSAP